MAHMPTLCPFHDACKGTMGIIPDVNVEFNAEQPDIAHCVTHVAVTCKIIARCNSCGFEDVVASEQKPLHFDQNFKMPELPAISPEEWEQIKKRLDERFYAFLKTLDSQRNE